MKTRFLSFFSLAAGYALLTSTSALVGVGCGGSGSGGAGGSTGTGGTTGGPTLDPANLISDFEDPAAATVLMSSGRNGYWYTYNDDNPAGSSAGCTQVPPAGPQVPAGTTAPTYVGAAPPAGPRPGSTGLQALHAQWMGCAVWGAGIGADLAQPAQDGGTYTGPKVEYDVSAYKGISFFAMAEAGSDTALRVKIPMSDETKTVDGGKCVEDTTTKCSDDFGAKFNLPSNGTWKQITIRWADTTFIQEGWGKVFPWNPAHVTSIQIQSQNKGEPYNFWIDDMYFITD